MTETPQDSPTPAVPDDARPDAEPIEPSEAEKHAGDDERVDVRPSEERAEPEPEPDADATPAVSEPE